MDFQIVQVGYVLLLVVGSGITNDKERTCQRHETCGACGIQGSLF